MGHAGSLLTCTVPTRSPTGQGHLQGHLPLGLEVRSQWEASLGTHPLALPPIRGWTSPAGGHGASSTLGTSPPLPGSLSTHCLP